MRRRTAVCLIATALLCGCAHQQALSVNPAMRWGLQNNAGEGPKLVLGVPETDDIDIMLLCAPKSGRVAITVAPVGSARSGRLELRSGAAVSHYRAIEPPAAGYEVLQARAPLSDPALQAFGRSGELTISVDGRREQFPAAGDKAAAFLASCRA
jgi:hypothetical protein